MTQEAHHNPGREWDDDGPVTRTARDGLVGDLWGGLASMLVALPASLAFGVAIYAPLGPGFAGQGALAGVLGAVAIGVVAPILGGTERLVSGPCAPAAAVMGALALELSSGREGAAPDPSRVLILLTLAALLSGGLQVLYGVLGGGTLIKYIPYPVVTGYLSGVGVVIFLKQLHGLFGFPQGVSNWDGLTAPLNWRVPGLIVGIVTITVMLVAPRLTKKVPAAILGLGAGVACYFGLAMFDPHLLSLEGNHLVIGTIGSGGVSFIDAATARFSAVRQLSLADLTALLMPALTLSVLLSIDTLKTCVVVDALTRTRHASNREIIGQGIANLVSACVGGVPGAGTSGATLVNIASGGTTRRSGVIEGSLVLAAYLLFGSLVAWAPIAALAGILVVVAYRMFDWGLFRLMRQRSTLLDFFVVVSVIAVAVFVGLVSASGAGIGLSILLFIREQIRGSVIHRKVDGNQIFSRQKRLPDEHAVLLRRGVETLVCELEGSLFFGTTDQLFTQLESDLKTRRYVILDMRRVRSVDLTAVHMLEQFETQLWERGATLVFSDLPRTLPTGQDLRAYFDEVGLVTPESHVKVFAQLSDALEWVEDRLLAEEGWLNSAEETALNLRDIDFLKGRKEETLRELEACAIERSYSAGEPIFRQGDVGDEILLVRRGRVRIALRLEDGLEHHIATFGRGDFFGDMAFLDRGIRSANAIAITSCDLLLISRERFDALAAQHPRLGLHFFEALARSLALRLRQADAEIRVLTGA